MVQLSKRTRMQQKSHYLSTSIETSPSSATGGAGVWRRGERREGGGAGDRDRLRHGDMGCGSSETGAARRLVEGSGDFRQGGDGGMRSSAIGAAISASPPATSALPGSGAGGPSAISTGCGAVLSSRAGERCFTGVISSCPEVPSTLIVLSSRGGMLSTGAGSGREDGGPCAEGAPTWPWEDCGVAGMTTTTGSGASIAGGGGAGYAGGAGVVDVDGLRCAHLSSHSANLSLATSWKRSSSLIRLSAASCWSSRYPRPTSTRVYRCKASSRT